MLNSADNFLGARATRSCLPSPAPAFPSPRLATRSCAHDHNHHIMSDKKPEPKELSDEYILAAIAKESKEFDKVRPHPLTLFHILSH